MQSKNLGTLADHSGCYRELCHLQHEIDALREENALLRSELAVLRGVPRAEDTYEDMEILR